MTDTTVAARLDDRAGEALVDAVVVGAGFAGLYALYRLREAGYTTQAFEAGAGVGGTWFWNRYPGARCDVESVDYSYSFSDELQQEWSWTERYAAQPEILRYLEHVAERFDLKSQIAFETRVTEARFREADGRWQVRTDRGDTCAARFCVMAPGVLSSLKQVAFPGLETFAGRTYHTARWPHEGVDFTGQRVGVVGTGSTGVQLIPVVAQEAEQLVVFQRTPNFSVPARNRPLDEEYVAQVKASYADRREESRASTAGMPAVTPPGSALEFPPEERTAIYESAWARGGGPAVLRAFTDIVTNIEANETAADFVRDKIRATVDDPDVAERLMPTDHPLGTKRICVDTDYYAVYNRPNVTLVDVRSAPIKEVTPSGVRTEDGALYELDVLVFATGFDAITGALLEIDVRGRDGVALGDVWAQGPRSYLGIGVAGFPNLFTITGPGSPSVLGNVVTSIEQHVDFVMDCLEHMREHGQTSVEVTPEAEEAWVERVAQLASGTLHARANSWYMGANIPGKPRIMIPFVGGVGAFRQICDEVAENGYEGFAFS